MEFTTPYTDHKEMAEAMRGAWGKDVGEDFSLVYFGQGVIGIADNTTILEKHVKTKHYDWINIGNKIWFAVIKER
jgi:hypothetical protein